MFKLVRRSSRNILTLLVLLFLIFSFFEVTVANGEDRPDLTINYIDFPTEISEDEEIEFVVKIKNIVNDETGEYRNISAGTNIAVALRVDGVVVSTNNTLEGLNVDTSCFVNLSWIAELGDQSKRMISIEVDYPETISESNENNNQWDGFIYVIELDTDLEIIDVDIPAGLVVNQTANILVSVRNNGNDTTSNISAWLNSSVDGKIEKVVKDDGLPRDDVCVFSFNWTPSEFGSQTISVDIIHRNKTHDHYQIFVIVGFRNLMWWNENWHYRQFITVDGNGNLSEMFNFTELLQNLGVFSQVFEDDTIRIVKYNDDGEVAGIVDTYKFNESIDYVSGSNANGTLLWNVTGSAQEKYYCVYFDVEINPGVRPALGETNDINISGDPSVRYLGFAEGWWAEIIEPIDGSFTFIDDSINISVNTISKAEDVTGFIFLNENESHNFTVDLVDVENKTSWYYENFYFDEEGNWTIRITASDKGGYIASTVEHDFYVGKPDLEIINLSVSTDTPVSPKVFIDDIVNISVIVFSDNATVENIDVLLSIYRSGTNEEIFNETITATFLKNQNNTFYFLWEANEAGTFEIKAIVDPNDEVNESDETNNEINKIITVHGWPDLKVKSIILPTITITEFDKVEIKTIIANLGSWDATDYEVELYIEPESQGIMKYLEQKDSTKISIDANKNKTIIFYWDSAEPGNWFVGVKVLVNDTKMDTNTSNNRLLCDKILKVKAIERNKPVIEDIEVQPYYQEQGGPITITAKVTDDSGLDSVTINIANPRGDYFEGNMTRTSGDRFKYTFTNTTEVGRYTFIISAVDISLYTNNASEESNFTINRDSTDPVVSYYDVIPYVQLKGRYVNISCIATDNVGIGSVEVVLTFPNGSESEETMTEESNNKYVYKNIYNKTGKYNYCIIATDKAGNKIITNEKIFWITTDLDDTDNDGMPDWWEEKYNLNPEDPSDAKNDTDKDGYSNLKEYKIDTNPMKDIFIENVAYRIKNNIWYLTGSAILFLAILVLSMIGERRKK